MEYKQEENDNEIVYMAHQCADIALAILTHKYEQKIQVMIKGFLLFERSGIDYDELYQVALIKLHSAIDTFREDKGASFRYYYLEITRHAMLDHLRYYHKKQYSEYCSSIHHIEEEAAAYMDDYTVFGEPELLGYTKQEVVEKIQGNSGRLTSVEMKILHLRLQGITYQEIANMLHITIKKVDNTLRKVRYKKD